MRSIPALRFVFDKYNLFASRVASSKLTICYFIFTVLHCVIQLGLQGHAFSTNAKAAAFLWDVVEQGDAKVNGVLSFGSDLEVCDSVENALSHGSCQLVWGGDSSKPVQSALPLSTSSIPASSPTSTLTPSSSLPVSSSSSSSSIPTITSSPIPTVTSSSISSTVTSTSVTVSPPNPLRSTTISLTRPSVPLPTTSPIFIGDKNDENDEGSDPIPLIVLMRREPEEFGKIHAIDTDGETEVEIEGLGHAGSTVVLSHKCLISLNWPATNLDNTKREDIVFIAFQFWVLGMSIVAILNESIPHIIASLLTHMAATGWGAFQIVHTNEFRTSFARLTTNGACGMNLLPSYWGPRSSAEIASLALNVLALLIGIVLSWRLIKAFGWMTFKRMGASMQIRRQYSAVLTLSVTIQLALFFIVASAGLWLDQLMNGVPSRSAKGRVAYEVVTVFVLVLLVPWLALGWTSVRKERRILMAVFLIMSTLYVASWGAMFASLSFRWTFMEWRFFKLMTSASVMLTTATLITGIVCRVGFGKGLPEHLCETRQTEDEDALFTPYIRDDISEISTEKVEFPPQGHLVPTFSATFGPNSDGAPSEKSQFPNPQMGPRFFYGSSIPFDQQVVPQPPPIYARQQPPTSTFTTHLYQYDRSVSDHSRTNSDAPSVESNVSRNPSGKKRWVIE